jgi:hypothetical protein
VERANAALRVIGAELGQPGLVIERHVPQVSQSMAGEGNGLAPGRRTSIPNEARTDVTCGL